MSWKVVWSEFAEKELDNIYDYHKENASIRVAQKLVSGILSTPNQLIQNQSLGQSEAMLVQLDIEYRYLVFKSYKIIYSLDNNSQLIKSADVFDTRQNPKKLKREK